MVFGLASPILELGPEERPERRREGGQGRHVLDERGGGRRVVARDADDTDHAARVPQRRIGRREEARRGDGLLQGTALRVGTPLLEPRPARARSSRWVTRSIGSAMPGTSARPSGPATARTLPSASPRATAMVEVDAWEPEITSQASAAISSTGGPCRSAPAPSRSLRSRASRSIARSSSRSWVTSRSAWT